ncbi:hypothetical protein [Paracoccus zhejiangensis]|uniref:Yip1 domain-containing protein n=1 Tax=Paracoccus zhejiangensis TaxID=1077935 RepID=A0A2H5F373_9RHOB|nr:hypothetical protein [Paracoccus zhejiangensis]AUH65977.1 hypothetical protein CX676_18935 [Paracoccus zhejiangensis]
MVAVIEDQRSSLLALIGIPVAGLCWSLGVWTARQPLLAQQGLDGPGSITLITAGGLAQTVALWACFSAVTWAMVRAAGGRLPLLRVMELVSRAALPLWVALPAAALWLTAPAGRAGPAAAVAMLAGLAFFALLVRQLSLAAGWGGLRAALPVAAAVIFVASIFTLAA